MYRILHFFICFVSLLQCCRVFAADIILGGIAAEHLDEGRAHPCGRLNERAVVDKIALFFAVREINDSTVILPGISLDVNMKDSCSNLDHAIKNTLDYTFVKKKFINTTVACFPKSKEHDECCMAQGSADAPLVAIIAGGDSHIVKAIVNLVGLFKVPVIGYSSTSPSMNKIDNFLRTIPSDTVTTQIMVDLIRNYRWNIVLVVYADTEFGHYAADSFRTALRRKEKICIEFDGKFSRTAGDVERIVKGIEQAKTSFVVAFFGTIEDFVFLAKHSNKHNFDMNKYVWITSEIWLRPDLTGMTRKITNVLSIIPKQSLPVRRFYDYLQNRNDVNLTCLPTNHNTTQHFRGTRTIRRLIGVSEVSCEEIGENCSQAHSKNIPYVFNAVYAVAMALHDMLECEAGKSCKENVKKYKDRSLLKHLRKVNFNNPLTNNTVSFDSNGNPRTTHHAVVKLEVGNNCYKLAIVGHWLCQDNGTCKRLESDNTASIIDASSFKSNCGAPCSKGEYKSVKEKFPDCCWQCERCTGNKFTNISSQLSCHECKNDHWPNSNHTACLKIHPEYLNMRTASGILLLVWDSLGIALSILVGVVFVKYSSSHIVRASSRQLSLLLLLSILLDFTLLVYHLAEPSRTQCTTIYMLSNVTGCLLTVTLFIKTNRIHRIFRKSAMKARPRCMGNSCQLFIILVLVLIEITLTSLNLFFHPDIGDVETIYLQKGDSKKAFVLCNFFGNSLQKRLLDALLWSYNGGMIFICTYQAYLVRKVPENYNEARYITFTMVTVSMTIIVYVITDSGMEGYNLEIIYCVFESVHMTVALVCMFFPKVYIILFQPTRNVPHNPVQSQLGTFVEDERTTTALHAGEGLNDGSLSAMSESSADSTASSATRRMTRSHRKVGVPVGNNNDTSPTRADSVGRRHEDTSSEPRNTVEYFAQDIHQTGGSQNGTASESTVIINGL